jgi:hypothetical protein
VSCNSNIGGPDTNTVSLDNDRADLVTQITSHKITSLTIAGTIRAQTPAMTTAAATMQSTADCKQAVRISREVEEGSVEHKWKLLAVSSDRLVHLTTQLNWRLNEGRGSATYMLGYTDGGDPSGLPYTELQAR